MKLVWFPTWKCNNYADKTRCPYCPYGWNNEKQAVTYQGDTTSKEGNIDPEIIKAFFKTNRNEIDGRVEVTGGEPLIYPHLSDVLGTGIEWSITSNTSIKSAIDKLIANGALNKCFYWTASYHPFSRRDAEFAECIHLLAEHKITVAITVVVSVETLPVLDKVKAYLSKLPVMTTRWHMETHKELGEGFIEKAEAIIGSVHWLAGKPVTGVICKKRSELMALSPAGELFECVTHCYTNKDSLGKVDGNSKIADLEVYAEQCNDECFACCDLIKHMRR